MLQGSKKRVYVLVMVLSLVLAGCEKDIDKAAETEKKAESSVVEADTKERTKTEFSTAKPKVAVWSELEKTPTKLEEVKKWGDAYDLRLNDLSALDLSGEYESMKNIVFDTFTIWPDKLPKGFDPEAVMETGKNPGLGIRRLHDKGITGKGVNIAIIDQMLLLEHQEYASRIKLYEQGNADMMASMHGPYVASLSVGKDIGVAPDAGLYFIGTYNFEIEPGKMGLNNTYFADAIDRLLEINASLPKEERIRAISMSACWCPENRGYEELTAAIERAKKEGVFVISCNMFENYGFWPYSLDKEPGTDPDKEESYKSLEWGRWIDEVSHITGFPKYFQDKFSKDFRGEFLLVPASPRTYAEATGEDAYCYTRFGGWSAMEPYITGLYAMACQVKPDITPELFWKTALETGSVREVMRDGNKYPARMLSPVALIEKLQQ